MSKNQNQVPRLDLAPKLKRPLSLWNPLDYLRLLYWVFFFPQAVRWYVETFGGKYVIEEETGWDKIWECLRKSAIERQLYLQALMLVVVTSIVLSWLLEQIGVSMNWSIVASNVTFGTVLGMAAGVGFGAAEVEAFGVAAGVGFGVTAGVGFGVAVGVCGLPLLVLVVPAAIFLPRDAKLSAVLGITTSIVLAIALDLDAFTGLVVGLGLTILRPESWLFSLPLTLPSPLNKYKALAYVSSLPIPYLSSKLTNWLRQDWETGTHNINQLLEYTLQFIPVVRAVNRVLAKTSPQEIIARVSQLAESSYNSRLVYFASVSSSKKLWSLALFSKHPFYLHKDTDFRLFAETRLDTPARATAAGFWHLYTKEPERSTEAFARVHNLLYGKEMFALAKTLATLHGRRKPITFSYENLPPLPTEPLLRPTTWEVIKSFQRVIADTQIVESNVSRSARSLALNRAQGELKNILDNIETIPQAERELIKEIAQTWQKALLERTAEVGQINITKPVNNPYTIGDPVVGKQFAGREDIIRQLQEYWLLTNNPQSIVLYGHRRMGKTSILLNIANLLGAKVKLAYINLLRVGSNPQGVGEVLIAITDAIAKEVNLEPPTDDDLLNLPYRNFERYLNRVIDNLDGSLIVALDEFEKIETLIANKKIPPDFMGFLRGMVQMNPKLAFALAGLHTLDEMTEDYFHPFFASIIPIRVSFLTQGATSQILANPGDEDFLLDYQPEALDRIYELTHGQPYLVQLVGFLLVRRYNELTFETGRPQKNIFTIEDVEAVIDNPDFYSHGRYYFTGVWDQAARGAKGQQQILTALAPHQKEGLTLAALSDATGIDTASLQTALETLERHDVVKRDGDNRRQIAVELLRRWLLL